MPTSTPALNDPWLPAAPVPPGRPTPTVRVGLYAPKPADGSDPDPYTWLDNVVPVTVRRKLGEDPGFARLRYRFTGLDLQAPQSIEEALSDTASLPKQVKENDRLVVQAQYPDGSWATVFYGFVRALGMHLDQGREQVVIDCIGTPRELWNTPIKGAVWRGGYQATNATSPDKVQTDEAAHFNAKGKGNRVPDVGWDPVANDGEGYPVFLDAEHPAATNWNLPDGVRYLIYRAKDDKLIPDEYALPKGSDLDDLLVAKEPIDGKSYDPTDPDTYTKKPIVIADVPIDGKPLPATVRELIGDKGFAFRWGLYQDTDPWERPYYEMELFAPWVGPRDTENNIRPPLDVWLQPRGAQLDLTLTNLGSAAVSRDLSEVVNQWEVEGELEEWEVSFVLTPNFPTVPADAISGTSLAAYDRSDPSWQAANRDKYRLWVLDESGESHYLPGSSTQIPSGVGTGVPTNLDAMLGTPIDGVPQYAKRRRKPIGDLITRGADGKPLRATLSVSTDYGVNTVQALTTSGTLTAGSFTLGVTAGGSTQTTTLLAYNATSAAVQSALQALSNVGTAGAIASGGTVDGGRVSVTFQGGLAGVAVPAMTVTGTGLTGGSLNAVVGTTGGKNCPAIWDGTGTWQPIHGGWKLLSDQIGVFIDVDNPNDWHIGKSAISGHPFRQGDLKGVECLANPTKANPSYVLRLTCVIRSDKRLRGVAKKQLNSILSETIIRRVDARDRYKRQFVMLHSEFNTTATVVTARDDGDATIAEANARQLATQSGVLGGPVEIPRFTMYYGLGDRIRQIQGRNLGFRTDNGGADATPVYPIVEAITWTFEPRVSTSLELSDANMARHSYASKIRRPGGRR